jgi:lysozyme family protein
MTNIAAITAENARLWKIAKIVPKRLQEVNAVAARLAAPAAKLRYEAVSQAVWGAPDRWPVVAVIHEREADGSWNAQLGQGDPLAGISKHVPRGRGPFYNHPGDVPGNDAWHRAAVDALVNCPPFAARWKDWSAGGILTILELYNGTGYDDYHYECSPYDWGATDQEEAGKYTGDGKYSASVWDTQIGCAAMRGKFDDYVGCVDLRGKKVIDFGTASGFLSFEAEKRGADVVSFDADSTARYTRLPHASALYVRDPEAAIREDNKWLDGMKRSYWFAHQAFRSKNRLVYGDIYNLQPELIGAFDVAILGQFLVHNRSGIDVLQAVAKATRDTMIITEGIWPIDEAGAKFIGSAKHPADFYSNWIYSPAFYREVLGMLGFRCESFTTASFYCHHEDHKREESLGVFVFRRN